MKDMISFPIRSAERCSRLCSSCREFFCMFNFQSFLPCWLPLHVLELSVSYKHVVRCSCHLHLDKSTKTHNVQSHMTHLSCPVFDSLLYVRVYLTNHTCSSKNAKCPPELTLRYSQGQENGMGYVHATGCVVSLHIQQANSSFC